jgi:hypothetical protein
MSDKDHTLPIDARPIPNYPGYLLRDGGEIWSCWSSSGRMTNVWHVMKSPKPDRQGYLRIELRGKIRRYVHDLVLEVFVGPCPPGMECCHRDGVSTNNFVANLRWGTSASNQADRARHGTLPVGEQINTTKLKDADIPVIIRRFRSGVTKRKLAEEFGVIMNTIDQIIRRKSWKHVLIPPDE